jgi:hypothetical protein
MDLLGALMKLKIMSKVDQTAVPAIISKCGWIIFI